MTTSLDGTAHRRPAHGRPALGPVLAVAVVVVLAVLTLLGVLVVLRGPDRSNANGSVPVDSVDDLEGRWTAVNDTAAPTALAAPVGFDVDGDRLVVRTGCNTGQGRVRVEDSRLRVEDGGLAVTEMGCDSPRTEQEAWVLDMVGSGPRLERSGPYLYLHWGDGEAYWLGLEQQSATP